MDIFLITVACLLFILGFAGCIVPFLPGAPFCYVAVLLLHLTSKIEFSSEFLLFWLLFIVLLSSLDYYLPILGTKHFGGSRWGVIGSTVGLVVGLFFAPWGIVLGPFLGAVLGELLSGKTRKKAIKAGLGSFVGFFVGTLAKLIASGFLIYYGVEAIVKI